MTASHTAPTVPAAPDIAAVGAFLGRPAVVADRSLEEMIFEGAEATVADAGLTFDDIDAVVISGADQVDGRVISCMVTAGAAAGVGRDLTMIASASEHALIYGYLRLRAGQGRNVLVLAWAKPSEGLVPEHAELVGAEPFILRPHGMNNTIAAALQASALLGAADARNVYGDRPSEFASWPLRKSARRASGDVVCGLLLATREAAPAGASPAWISGLGWAVERYELGDRDLTAMTALRSAATQAYAMAGIESAPRPDAVRLQCPSPYGFAPALRALNIPRDCARPVDAPDGDAPGYPSSAAGLAALAMVAEEIRSSNGDAERQRLGVGVALHGFAGQGASVMVFRRSLEGRL